MEKILNTEKILNIIKPFTHWVKEEEVNDLPEQSFLDRYFDLYLELARSVKDVVILKGNILLNKLFSDTARLTRDLDLSIF